MERQEQYNADMARGGCYSYIAPFMKYNSVKYIQVYDWRLACIQYALQFAILFYVIGYTVIIKQGYQGTGLAVTSVTTKLKGSAMGSSMNIYDANDLVVPPTEPNAMFITLNYIATANQTRGTCEGIDSDGSCKAGCKNGVYTYNGVQTGKCGSSGQFCEINAWCPVEDEDSATPVNFSNVNKWTLFIRTNAYWPDYNFGRSNTENGGKPTLGVNLFTLEDMVGRTGYQFNDVTQKGAVILISMKFDCNLDNPKEDCEPSFTFTRVDISGSDTFSEGFNYRYVRRVNEYPLDSPQANRNLYKVTGLRILLELSGVARKFSIAALSTTIGAGLSFLAVATIVADFVMQNVLKEKDLYKDSKFQDVRKNSQTGVISLEDERLPLRPSARS
eukprot:TRINITY_DN7045_c0_g1_i1.p1 TRINITY_DN7045_c0_g1~~TRINITY_DN7045_c0_g1_i1.p1  ORF type:complete len:388 (-),score=93.47 TRINITY_DN7045_c0_g1_i1:379-1542(-)